MIHSLPRDVVVKIRSGLAINNVTHCVEELVWNSIDADANHIAVRLNLPYFKIQVIDDGSGVPFDQLELLGERYATSKCSSLKDLRKIKTGGFRGEALASMKEVSAILMIETRHESSKETYSKMFTKNNDSTTIQKSASNRANHGTTVTLHDFLYNMPVRRQFILPVLDLENCSKSMEKISIMFPHISFSLRDDSTGTICLETKQCTSLRMSFRQVYGKEKSEGLKEISFQKDGYELSGLISLNGHINKDLQLFYVNKRIVSRCKLHKLVSAMLQKVVLKWRISKKAPKVATGSQSPVKSHNCNGVFVLNLSCPYQRCDVTSEPQKRTVLFTDEQKVLNFVDLAVSSFFRDYELLPAVEQASNVEKQPNNSASGSSLLKCNVPKKIEQVKTGLFSLAVRRPFRNDKSTIEMANLWANSDVDTIQMDVDEPSPNPCISQPKPGGKKRPTRQRNAAVQSYIEEIQSRRRAMQSKELQEETRNNNSCLTVSKPYTYDELEESSKILEKNLPKIMEKFGCKSKLNKYSKETVKNKIQTEKTLQNDIPKASTSNAFSHFCFEGNANLEKQKKMKFRQKELDKQALRSNYQPKYSDADYELGFSYTETEDTQEVVYDSRQESTVEVAVKKPKFSKYFSSFKPLTCHDILLCNSPYQLDVTVPKESQNMFKSKNSESFFQFPEIELTHETRETHLKPNKRDISKKQVHFHIGNNSASESKKTSPYFASYSSSNNEKLQDINNTPIFAKSTIIKEFIFQPSFSKEASANEENNLSDVGNSQQEFQPIEKKRYIENWLNALTFQPVIDDLPKAKDKIVRAEKCSQTSPFFNCVVSSEKDDPMIGTNNDSSQSNAATVDSKSCNDNMTTIEADAKTGADRKHDSVVDCNIVLLKCGNKGLCSTDVQEKLSGEAVSHFFLTRHASQFVGPPVSVTKQQSCNVTNTSSIVEQHLSLQEEQDISAKWRDAPPNTSVAMSTWVNPMFERPTIQVDTTGFFEQGMNAKTFSALNKHRITKKMLSTMEVIGQVDNKFIAGIARGMDANSKAVKMLVLFDQHAVHERIRLEELTEDLYKVNATGEKIMKLTPLCPPLKISFTASESRLLKAYAKQLLQFGITLVPNKKENVFDVQTVPPILFDRLKYENKKNKNGTPSTVEVLIHEWLTHLQELRATSNLLPKSLRYVLNSQACRGAVKFGDPLKVSQCETLIKSLSLCNLPFQCAHGRPCIAPILDLNSFNETKPSPEPRYDRLFSHTDL